MHKYFGYGDFFCWHCGKRMHVGKRKCPHCGAKYSGKGFLVSPVKKAVTTHPGMGVLHPTALRYIFQFLLYCFITGVVWCCIMYFVMDVTFEEQGVVYIILWSLWLLCMVCFAAGKFSAIVKTSAKNRLTPPGGYIKCAMCGDTHSRHENYCSRCGTVLFVDHPLGDHPPVESGKRADKNERADKNIESRK